MQWWWRGGNHEVIIGNQQEIKGQLGKIKGNQEEAMEK